MHINNQCTSDCRRVGCPDDKYLSKEYVEPDDNQLYDPAKDPSIEKEEEEPIPF